ncbi:MAG: tRNA 5-methoxyuridine(34)/uridine 5-oxyacetic acid(34) synthase CmoB [Gammaproteobacteria bacterium]|nr:tRNA 5-methoxyuridine(34)/uridine 5-oxyacetic acid(34) synthase CmoB [Gammaproteobacteria bacterium]
MGLEGWSEQLAIELPPLFDPGHNGNLPRWLSVLEQLPPLQADRVVLDQAKIQLGSAAACSEDERSQLEQRIRELMPWRKGPFELFGLSIDTEWRSDWKWARIQSQIQPLAGRIILDVGCGNGYYALRMAGAGADTIIGVDPNLLFMSQFQLISRYIEEPLGVHLVPVGLESIPDQLQRFDTVFSMGVLYHRRSPIDHLYQLCGTLRSGGELVLETLVVEGGVETVLVPEGRYAKMRNVWFIPSVEALILWLRRVGFQQIRCLNQSVTTVDEQRSTEWMRFESLSDFLDPQNSGRTVEGYPAPRRALLSAVAP